MMNDRYQSLLHMANENMKKLNVSIFRTNFKKEKSILQTDKKKHFADLIDIEEMNDTLSTIQDGGKRSVNQSVAASTGMETKYRDQHVSPQAYILEPNLNVHESSGEINASSLNDLNSKLNTKLSQFQNSNSPPKSKRTNNVSLLSNKKSSTQRAKPQRVSIPTANDVGTVAQSFDFSVLDGN